METLSNRQTTPSGPRYRVLVQIRPRATQQRGGDTEVAERLAAGLSARGIEVVFDERAQENPANFDLVHLFNFATPDFTRTLAERAFKAGVPFVVTTLNEDLPLFYNQSLVQAHGLIDYVRGGQKFEHLQSVADAVRTSAPAKAYDNTWVAEHAAALLSSGPRESESLRRTYAKIAPIEEIAFGHNFTATSSRELFAKAHGLSDFVLCVGRAESRKNQLMLLAALEDSDLPVVLITSGVCYQPEYDQAVRSFRRRGKTLILNRVEPSMLASAYSSARVHVLPSWYELPGLVSLEAASLGSNVVVSDFGSARDYLGYGAFYCSPSDRDSVKNAVLAGFYAPANDSLAQHVSRFTWERHVERTVEVYGKIVGHKPISATPTFAINQIPVAPQASGGSASTIEALLKDGEEAARKRNYHDARSKLTAILDTDPRNVRALRSLGAVALAENRISEAQEVLERGLLLAPEDARCLSGLAMCAMSGSRWEDAYALVLRALGREDDRLVTIMQLIELSYKLERYADLERILRAYTGRHSDDAEMLFCLAGCLFKSGKFPEAVSVNEQVKRMKPAHKGAKDLDDLMAAKTAPPATTVVCASEARGQEISQPLSTPPISPVAHSISPEDLRFQNTFNELEGKERQKNFVAVREGMRALMLETPNKDQRERLECLGGEVLVLEGKFEEGSEVFRKLLSANPGCARAIAGLGAVAAVCGRWTEARQQFASALELDPGQDVGNAGMGMCVMMDKDYEGAWSYYQRALSRNPEHGAALLGTIQVAYKLERFVELEGHLITYLDMHPGDINFLYSLAGCLYAQGRHQEALSELEKVTLLQPGHELALELKNHIRSGRRWAGGWETMPAAGA